MFGVDNGNHTRLSFRTGNTVFTILLILVFWGCRSSEKQVMHLYSDYVDKMVASRSSELLNNTNKEMFDISGFQRAVLANPDFLFFPATLWQVHFLDERESYDRQAMNYSTAIRNTAPVRKFLNGEVLESLFLTPYTLEQDEKMLEPIIETLSAYISDYESRTKGENTDVNTHLELLLENKVLFFATKKTGDPVFRNFALDNSSDLYETHFRNNLRILSVLGNEISARQVECLNSDEFYRLAVGLYGFLMLYEETEMTEYLQFCEKIAFLFDCIYNSENDTVLADTQMEVEKKIDLVSKSLVSIALFDLAKYSDKNYRKVSSKIYANILRELELGERRKMNAQNIEKNGCSFRLLYYLLQYELRKQTL